MNTPEKRLWKCVENYITPKDKAIGYLILAKTKFADFCMSKVVEEALNIAIIESKKEVFDDIEKELFHKDKEHFEYNSSATFKKLEKLKKRHLKKR